MSFSIIAACSKDGGIGLNGKLPWKNFEDMEYFRKTTKETIDKTKRNAVIMGRKTFESLNCRALPGRINICLTKQDLVNIPDIKNVHFFNDINEALFFVGNKDNVEKIFIIGGASLYDLAMRHCGCKELIINKIDIETNCDTFFPSINEEKYELKEQSKISELVTNYIYVKKYKKFEIY